MLTVINKNSNPFTDGFRGIRYTFPVNTPVQVQEDVANHIFGWTENNDPIVKKDAAMRLGLTSIDPSAQAKKMAFLNNFAITTEEETANIKGK